MGSLVLALLVPERYQQMIARASEYGNDRILMGAHYAMDVLGGRTLAAYDLAQSEKDVNYRKHRRRDCPQVDHSPCRIHRMPRRCPLGSQQPPKKRRSAGDIKRRGRVYVQEYGTDTIETKSRNVQSFRRGLRAHIAAAQSGAIIRARRSQASAGISLD